MWLRYARVAISFSRKEEIMDSVKAEGASNKFHAVQIALEHLAEPETDIEKFDLSSLACVMAQANRELDEALDGNDTKEGSHGQKEPRNQI
jgi:hypothetical protein